MPRNGIPGSELLGQSGPRKELAILCGFVAMLLWWIGITGYVAVGGVASGAAGLGLFLGLPAVATAGTYLVARRRRGPTSFG